MPNSTYTITILPATNPATITIASRGVPGPPAYGNVANLTEYETTITDSKVSSTSHVMISLYTNGVGYDVWITNVANGSFTVQTSALPSTGDQIYYIVA